MPLVATGMDLEESYINKLASQGKTIVSYLPSMQDGKRAAKELTYNTKRDSENSNTKSPSPKKVKGMN